MSAYHSKMLRIPHHDQHPKKRYLTEEEILEVFNGEVWIQEKVDGKQSILELEDGRLSNGMQTALIIEDMTGKNTVHNHVMHYNRLPITKKIVLDKVTVRELKNGEHKFIFEPPAIDTLTYGRFKMVNPTITQIHILMNALSHMYSHFGSDVIEGLIIKNYRKQIAAKWINQEFEDKLPSDKLVVNEPHTHFQEQVNKPRRG